MKLAGSIITRIQVGEERQKKWRRDSQCAQMDSVCLVQSMQGRGEHLCFLFLCSSPLPHFIFQAFPAGASLPTMSSVICCLLAGWQWAILKWIRVLLLISFQVPPVDNPCFRLIKPAESRLSHRSLSTNRRC